MSNMSYCRFENTVPDLQDCFDHWDDAISYREQVARKRMLKICQDIVEYCEDNDEAIEITEERDA